MKRGAARTLLMLVLLAAGIALLVLWVVFLFQAAKSKPSAADQKAFGHLTALVFLALFTVAIHLLGRGVGGLVIGHDGRVSTSKVQLVMWTYVIAASITSLIAATWVGFDAGFDKLTDPSFDVEDYLVLLGGPFAAAISARAIVGSQVANGERAKPPGDASAAQVLTNDEGRADLVDSQYLLFNLVAVIYFVGAFIQEPQQGLPDIPTVLLVLAGVSAVSYVSNKAIAEGTPQVTGVFPAKGPPDTPVEVFGTAFLYPKQLGSADVTGAADLFHEVRVMIGGYEATQVAGSLSHSRGGDDRLKVLVPTQLAPAVPHDVTVLNFRGTASTASTAAKFEVVGPTPPTQPPAGG
ncbi:MAG: hypothetical protein M3340_13660 [Actinomycetota bacterium]|nr:hypothetical protein [Actinomycetota bacterium]